MNASRSRRGLVLLAAASLMATAACGSTVQSGGQTASGGGGVLVDGGAGTAGDGLGGDGLGGDGLTGDGPTGDGLGGDGAEAPGAADSVLGVPDGSAGGAGDPSGGGGQAAAPTETSSRSGGGGGAGPQQAPSGGGAGGGGAAKPAAFSGPGVTATEIKIGLAYCGDCAGANAALGAGGEDPGDTRRYFRAVVDDVNARGGVAGRKLVPIFHEISASDNIDQSAQEACETFTKDNKVAYFSFRGAIAAQCGLNAGIFVGGQSGIGPYFEKFPNGFNGFRTATEDLYAITVRALVKQGWHKPDATYKTGKIGLITWDTNEYRFAMKNGYLKAMNAAGLKAEDVRYIAVPQNAGALADASSAISSAVLSFQQRGVDHVFIGDGPAGIFAGTGLTFLFLQNAESQKYRPRYGFNTNNSPDFDSHPKGQLVNMLAVDSISTDPKNDEGITPNAQRVRCFNLMKKRGLPVAQDQTRNVAVAACEAVWLPEAVFNKSGGTSLKQVIPGAESLGTSYRSPAAFGTKFAPDKHNGGYLFRNLRFDTGCKCVKYTSKPYEP